MISLEGRNSSLFKEISIIIPTCNRVNYTRRLFISLYEELKFYDKEYEVIVIDSSELNERIKIAELSKEFGYNFYFLDCSISEARNFGISVAKYPIILFIDSDCEVVSGILIEHLSKYVNNNIAAVLGLTKFEGKRNWVWEVIERTSFNLAFSFANRMDYALWGPCSNISFRKDIIEDIGGFKTDFPFNYSGEDVDIGLRLNEAGYRIKCNPNAIVNHNRETWSHFWQICKKVFRWGRTDVYLLKDHPDFSHAEFPKFIPLICISLIYSLILSLFGFIWEIIIFMLLWVIITPSIVALFKISDNENNSFILNYLSFWLSKIFEFGTVIESIRKGKISIFYRKLLYGKEQLSYEWKYKVIECWSYTITFLIFIIIIFCFF